MKQLFIFFIALLLSCSAPRESDAKLIIGTDNRKEVLATGYPYSAIGRLQIGNGGNECTATLLWRNLIMTSAHCVKGAGGTISFSPNYADNEIRRQTELPLRPGDNVFAKAKLLAMGNYQSRNDVAEDWAILRLDSPLGDRFNWLETATVMESGARNAHLAGYSQDFFRDVHARGVASEDSSCSIKEVKNNVVLHDCDSDEGASGAPLFFTRSASTAIELLAIHGGGDTTVDPARNVATAVQNFKTQLDAAIAAEQNLLGYKGPPPRIIVDRNGNTVGGIAQIATGAEHTCAVSLQGKLRCWGLGKDGRLGYTGEDNIGVNETPAMVGDVPIGGGIKQVVAGDSFTCALHTNGNVRCWGNAKFGQLGYGNTETLGDDEPVGSVGYVTLNFPVKELTAGANHVCALSHNGKGRCWGSNMAGQLGDIHSYRGIRDEPRNFEDSDLSIAEKIKQIAAGAFHSCALTTKGAVRCWGFAGNGQLGYGNINNIGEFESMAESEVDVGGKVEQIAAGALHTCALLTTGKVRCWGDGRYGELGYGNRQRIGDDETPAMVGDVDVGGFVKQITAGQRHTCALLQDGKIRCWGHGGSGQLGVPWEGKNDWRFNRRDQLLTYSIGDEETPASIPAVPLDIEATNISAGGSHSCALLVTGKMCCWGKGLYGQLGYANSEDMFYYDDFEKANPAIATGF